MKRKIFLLLLILPLFINAQGNKWGIYTYLGVDMGGAIPFPFSDIPKGSKGTPKILPGLGLGYEYNLSDKWELNSEISYHVLSFSANAKVRSQSFYFDNHQSILYFSGNTSTDVELRFLEIDLFTNYCLNSNWALTAGPYYSKIFEGSFNTTGTKGIVSDNIHITDTSALPGVAEVKYNFNDFIDSWDAGILLGFRYSLNHKIFFWGKFNIGLKSIFKPDFDQIDYEMYQLRLNIGVTISLYTKERSQLINEP